MAKVKVFENMKQVSVEIQTQDQREKEGFLEAIENLRLHINNEKVIDRVNADFLKIIFTLSLRRGYEAIDETELQMFLNKNLGVYNLGPDSFLIIIKIFKHMSDCVTEGIDKFSRMTSQPSDKEEKVKARAVLILYKLRKYLSFKSGEKNQGYQEAANQIIKLIKEAVDRKSFLASHND